MRFACVWVGDKYPIEFVHRLRRGVELHYPHPHEFVCFTDKPKQVKGAKDISGIGLKGWWAKLALLDPSIRGDDWTVYLDLDTVIVGSLEPLANLRSDFAICENFILATRKSWGRYGSCVMTFPPGWGADHWKTVQSWRNIELVPYGDQGVIEKLVPNATILQRALPSGYFLHYREFGLHPHRAPETASLVIYAGKRNPENYGPQWAYQAWVA